MNGTGNESKPTVHWTRYAVGVLATLAGLLLVWYFRDIVGYIIVSAVLAIIGTPLAKLMKRVRVRGRSVPDWLAALVVLLLLWGVGVAMFAIDWRMGLALLVTIPVALIPMTFGMRTYNKNYAAYMEANAHVNSVIVEYVEGIQVVKAFSQGERS